MSTPSLFQPISIGDITLKHRVVLAPLTRFRANDAHVHGQLAVDYYSQRGSVPGTLLITEGTFIAAKAGGYPNVPGIWSDEQIAAWKKITDAVHAKGSFIFLQLWAIGRAAKPEHLKKEDPSFAYTAPSPIKLTGIEETPRALTIPEIKEYVQLYGTAASNAVHKAGFDGVEIHGANGYLIDQFLQDVSNNRTDEYGGSVENRTRFALEVVDAVVKTVGEKKTGIRLSPWSTFQDMGMREPKPTFSHLVTKLRDHHPSLAYIHVVEPVVSAGNSVTNVPENFSNDFIRDIWADGNRRLISCGGYSREQAIEVAGKNDEIIGFGRWFLANPDLPLRLERDLPLNKGDRNTYYVYGSTDPTGYTSYPFATEVGSL